MAIFSALGSIASRWVGDPPLWFERTIALATLSAGFWTVARLFGPRIWAVVALGAASEIVGLYTGFPFGSYTYSENWWPTVPLPDDHRFPILLPFAWGMIAGAAAAANWRRPVWMAGLLAAMVDLVMEPAMADVLGYWTWAPRGPLPGGAPLLNFFGWFLVASLAALVLGTSERKQAEPTLVLAGQVLLSLALLVR